MKIISFPSLRFSIFLSPLILVVPFLTIGGVDLPFPLSYTGWGPAPQVVLTWPAPGDAVPGDYYYSPVSAQANSIAISRKNTGMIRGTCTSAARVIAANAMLQSLLIGALRERRPQAESGTVVWMERGKQKAQCQFVRNGMEFEVMMCGGAISGLTIVNCVFDLDENADSYGSCSCQVGMQIPGGKKAFLSSLVIR